MHRIAVGGGMMGALFTVGTILIFVMGLPMGPWFLSGSILLGTGVAAALYLWHQKNPVELTDLHYVPPANPAKQPSLL